MGDSNEHSFDNPDLDALLAGAGRLEYSPDRPPAKGLLEEVMRRHESALLAIPGVVMVSVGTPAPGVEAIVVGVDGADALERLPKELEGCPVQGEVVGPIVAL